MYIVPKRKPLHPKKLAIYISSIVIIIGTVFYAIWSLLSYTHLVPAIGALPSSHPTSRFNLMQTQKITNTLSADPASLMASGTRKYLNGPVQFASTASTTVPKAAPKTTSITAPKKQSTAVKKTTTVTTNPATKVTTSTQTLTPSNMQSVLDSLRAH